MSLVSKLKTAWEIAQLGADVVRELVAPRDTVQPRPPLRPLTKPPLDPHEPKRKEPPQ